MKKYIITAYIITITALMSCSDTKTESMAWAGGQYTGEVVDGKPQGYGTWTNSQLTYKGEWKKGQRNGFGISTWKNGNVYRGEYKNDRICGQGILKYASGAVYKGEWKSDRKDGYGVLSDSTGIFTGIWEAGRIDYGTARYPKGVIYEGYFNTSRVADGVGCLTTPDGSVYDGHYQAGVRSGFGFAIEKTGPVKCGFWVKGKYQGEKILYSTDRVYGIDVSRFQHEHDKKRYAIHWGNLSITSLGTKSQKRIKGDNITCPVTFVYIKATEGKQLLNKYYAADIHAARRNGYVCGAYHFFTPADPIQQARFFCKSVKLRKGDLPPMLDIEPTEDQIVRMGGEKSMFQRILVWVRIVQRQYGVKPILYCGQLFLNRHYAKAPEELKKYDLWIARYGEYKPFYHLQYWQLAEDGVVKGIHGNVDINVFNGSHERFKEYVSQNGIK
ncbi:MAG: glycosyl hydrolase family 25 [Bacteroidaceae bacterium]|jgi:lysozyme|nr:glycosyl hydrolase family 25 [Bacteroidaceae bacterium]